MRKKTFWSQEIEGLRWKDRRVLESTNLKLFAQKFEKD